MNALSQAGLINYDGSLNAQRYIKEPDTRTAIQTHSPLASAEIGAKAMQHDPYAFLRPLQSQLRKLRPFSTPNPQTSDTAFTPSRGGRIGTPMSVASFLGEVCIGARAQFSALLLGVGVSVSGKIMKRSPAHCPAHTKKSRSLPTPFLLCVFGGWLLT